MKNLGIKTIGAMFFSVLLCASAHGAGVDGRESIKPGKEVVDVTDGPQLLEPVEIQAEAIDVTAGDVDGDGDLDLLVTALGGPNAAFINDGSGRFSEATDQLGLTGSSGATTMALADVDMDGDLDLYLTNYKTVMAKDIYSPFERSFHQIVSEDDENPRIREKFIDHYTICLLYTSDAADE